MSKKLTKTCTKQISPDCCGESDVSLFVPNRRVCKACFNLKAKRHYDDNKDYYVTYHKMEYELKANEIKQRSHSYYLKNADKVKAKSKAIRDAKREEKLLALEDAPKRTE